MIADGDHMLLRIIAGQDAPSSARRPHRSALHTFAGQINAGRARSIGSIHLGWSSVRIHEDAALFVGGLKPVSDANPEQSLFVIIEDNLIERLQSSDLIDDARILLAVMKT